MTIEDYPALAALWKSTEGIGLSQADSPEAIAVFLHRNPGLSAVAEHDGAVVGGVLCGHDGRRGCLYHLAVHPSKRRQGIAAELIDWCLKGLAAEGIAKCNAFVFSDNGSGGAFWEHAGWALRSDLTHRQIVIG